MARRLAALLFSAAMILASVAMAPCTSQASCALASGRRMDCCTAKTGISVPRCCNGNQQVSSTTPATPEQPIQSTLAASAMHVAPARLALANSPQTHRSGRIDAGPAPPGGTLIAQHTSLLL
jgi:hypothetical protein